MTNESNIRTLRPVPAATGPRCAMCASTVDVVLCSFAFERIHRRVPLCRGHRQPLIEIDHFTRPTTSEAEDVPPAWLAAGPASAARRPAANQRRPSPAQPAAGGATLTLLTERRASSRALATSGSPPAR